MYFVASCTKKPSFFRLAGNVLSIDFDIMSHWALLHNCNMISSPAAPNNTIINAFCCKLHKHTRFVYIGGECVEALALTSFSIRLCYTIVICSGTPSPRASLQAAPLPPGPPSGRVHMHMGPMCAPGCLGSTFHFLVKLGSIAPPHRIRT